MRYRLARLQVHVPLGRSKLRDQRPERPVTGPIPASGLQRTLKPETARILGTCTCASAHTATRLCSGFTALRVRKSSCGIDHAADTPADTCPYPRPCCSAGSVAHRAVVCPNRGTHPVLQLTGWGRRDPKHSQLAAYRLVLAASSIRPTAYTTTSTKYAVPPLAHTRLCTHGWAAAIFVPLRSGT